MRTVEIPFPDELLQLVDDRARITGLDRDTYIRAILSKEVGAESPIGEILSSFREQVANSGTSDDELDQIFHEARDEAYRERRRSYENR